MKWQSEDASEAPPELPSQDGAELAAELLDAPELQNAPESPKANDAGLQAPNHADLSLQKGGTRRMQTQDLPKLRLLWAKRQVTLHWAMAGCCAATALALVIPKQYVSTAKLMPPEAQSASKLAGFGSIAGDFLKVNSTGALLVAMMRSRTTEDRMIDRFNLKKVYRVGTEQEARARLEKKSSFSLESKSGIVMLSVTDGDPQRATAMARGYVEELETLIAQLNNSSAHRERVFLQEQLQIVKVDMDTAEKELSEFASKNVVMDVTEQIRVMIENVAKLQRELIVAESQLQEVRQIYSDSSLRVRSLQARIFELVDQQKKLVGTYSGKSFVDGDTYGGSSFPSLRQLPIMSVPYESKFRKLQMEEAVYEKLRTEFDSAKVQEARENPYVEVLDLPEVPEHKSFPPRLLIITTGTGCAVILSGLWILGVARWREIDAQHAGMVLAREIFGTMRW
jgi:capsule polysaccharide export protein KpsE/RkpR